MLTVEAVKKLVLKIISFFISIFTKSHTSHSNPEHVPPPAKLEEGAVRWVRPLGYVERFMTSSETMGNMCTVYALWLTSKESIPFESIKYTSQLMFRKMPHLRLCLGNHKHDLWWREMDSEQLDIEEIHSDEEVVTIMETLLKRRHNTEKGPLWFVRFLKPVNGNDLDPNSSGNHKTVCMFGFHHNFSDGTTNMNFCNLFLALLNDVLQNKVLDLKEQGYFAYPIQDDLARNTTTYYFMLCVVFTRLYKYFIIYGNYVKNFIKQYPLTSDGPGCTLILQNEMSEAETQSLLKRCKMESVTLNSAFTAAANISMLRMILQKDDSVDDTEFDSQQTINMRRYWPKDKQKHAYGCHIFTIGVQMQTNKNDISNFWDYVRKIQNKMYLELNVEKRCIKTHPLSQRLGIPMLFNFITSKFGIPSTNEGHYCITNMGNISSTFSGDGEKVNVSKILRSVSGHFMPSLCQHTLQTFRGKFYYSLDYYPNKMSVGTARAYVSSLMDTLRTSIHSPN